MITKHLLRADRQRQIPPSFSWVDHRLIRHAYLRRCDHTAWALYLFLLTVGDVEGLSYYSDAAICRHLNLELRQLASARHQLLQADLIAYQKPLYQVLSLPQTPAPEAPPSQAPRTGQVGSLGEMLKQALNGGSL